MERRKVWKCSSFTFWVNPDINSSSSGESVILSKFGIPTMNHFKILKQNGNGSMRLDYFPDGEISPTSYTTESEVLSDGNWSLITLTYNAEQGNLALFSNGILMIDQNESFETNGSLPFGFRFCNLIVGDQSSSFSGMIDDLRFYEVALTQAEIQTIYNAGGGDYQTIEITGFGTTRITAHQNGNHEFEKAMPVFNYLTVTKADQSINFSSLINRSVGDFPFELEANASSGLPIEFSISDLAIATLNEKTLELRNSGNLTVTASQSGSNLFNPADPVSQTFTIGYGNLFADSIPGLSLWLDATDINYDKNSDDKEDFLDQNKISLWADRSGNFNSPVQASYNQMPTWKPNSIHNLSLVEFSTNLNQLLELQLPISDPSLVLIVLRQLEPDRSNIFGGDYYFTSSNGKFELNYNGGNALIPSFQNTESL